MGPGEGLLSYGVPLLLLAGALCRVSLPSFIYLVGFAITAIWSPHPLLPRRKTIVNISLWVLSIYSGLMCLGHIIFQAVLGAKHNYGRSLLPDTGTATTVLQFVGFQRIPNVGEGFRLITPDVVVFGVMTTFVILLKRRIVYSREYLGYAKNQPLRYIPRGPSTLNSLAILGVLLLNGLAFASGLQSVYFLLFQAALVAKAFFRSEINHIVDFFYLPIFIYDIIHIIAVYVVQVDPIQQRIPATWTAALGFKYYDVDITPNPLMGVTICLSWASSLILLILLSFRKRNIDLRALNSLDRSYLSSSSLSGESPTNSLRSYSAKETRFWRIFRRLVRDWGWRICVVALLAIPLFLPSFLSVFLLFSVCIAAVVPQIYLEKYMFIPGVTIYLIAITIAQYIYNIPHVGVVPENNMSALYAVGFRVYEYTWFQIGLQALACTLLAINWGYYSKDDPNALKDSSSRRHKQLDENSLTDEEGLLLDDDEVDRQRGAARHSRHHHRRQQHDSSQGVDEQRATSRRRAHNRETSFMGFLSYHDDEPEDDLKPSLLDEKPPEKKKGRCGRCLSRISEWWKDVRPALKSVGFWALKQSYLLCLSGVYVAGLHQVNILNSVYLLILILFLISPRIARQFWIFLVLYCEVVIMVVYTWSATPWTLNIHAPNILPVIGLRSYPTTTLLFTQGLVWHLVILLFAVLQLWVLRYTATLVKKGQDRPTEKIPRWMRAIGDTLFWLWDEYGLIPVYTILVGVASADGDISFINIMYITLVFVCLTIHMLTRKADIHIKRFWIFVVIASGVILLTRYAYQFKFLQDLLSKVLPAELITAIGFVDFAAGAVFAPLLGNTFVFLVAVIQLQTFFAKKDAPVGVGHNAHAKRLVTASDFEYGFSETATDFSDYESSSSRPSSLPGSFKFGSVPASSSVGDYDSEHVPQGSIPDSSGYLSTSFFSADEARVISERGSSGRSERTVSASQRLIMDEELMAEDIAKHPTSTLQQRKRRLRRKHVLETIIWTWALDIIYWLKRFCMLHIYKITAITMIAIAVKTPSGLNSIYVEVALLSVSADHLTDGVGLLLLLYTELSVLFVLVYQFSVVHDGLSAYLPLVSWAGFDWLPKNRFALISAKLAIVGMLLLQRFAHRWKNDWYRVKKIEVEHELEPPNSANADIFYSDLASKHAPTEYRQVSLDEIYTLTTEDYQGRTNDLKHPMGEHAPEHSKFGILQQLRHLSMEDERDNKAIEDLKKQYLLKTELTLFLYDSSDFLVMNEHFNFYEAWNVFAWLLSNLLTICGYPALVSALLLVVLVHKETVYGVIFLLLLGLTIITPRRRWTSSGWPIKVLTIYVAIELLLQYVLNLDLPPPDLRYPWYDWNPAWLSWLGLKQSKVHSGMLIADFVLLLVVARIRRITSEDMNHIKFSRYWHYLVGPVVRIREAKTWRDSVRYSVYRFSPFVILLLIFIAGTIHPDVLSLIYVVFALLFIFRESTIYAQRNKIWRWARLYNFILILVILLYQIPAIKLKSSSKNNPYLMGMSAARIIGLRKFSEEGGSILFSLFIFVLLGIQKRLFSRVEFDELVLSILDEEEKGVRMAQERFQEWKMERRREFQHVQEEKRKRRRQLDFLKAARTRQQKLWQRLAKGGADGRPPASADATIQPGDSAQTDMSSALATAAAHQKTAVPHASQFASHAAASFPAHPPSYGDYVNDPRMRTLSTTRDLKLLESAGGLTIEEDPNSRSLRMKFKSHPAPSTLTGAVASSSSQQATSMDTQGPEDEVVLKDRGDDPTEDDVTEAPEDEEPLPEVDSDEEEDVLATALQQPRKSFVDEEDEVLMPKCCQCLKVPQFVITASDIVIHWLDTRTDGYLSQKPHYSRKRKIWAGVYKLYQINSSMLCYLFFMINCAVYSDLISLFFPLSMFLYALLETPRPHKLYWNTIFVYTALVITVKFFYQFSLFCTCTSPPMRWALASQCATDPTCIAPLTNSKKVTESSSFHFTAPRLTGIVTFSSNFVGHIVPDLLVLISVFMHRYWLKKLGYWNFVQRLTLSKEGSDEPMSQKQLLEESKRFEQVLLKQQKKRESWTRYAAEKKKHRYAKKMRALGDKNDKSPLLEDDPSMDIDIESGPSQPTTIKVVSNPLFKVGESDFETDAEEMSTRSPGSASRQVHFEVPPSSGDLPASSIIPNVSLRKDVDSAGDSTAAPSSVSSVIGSSVSSLAARRRGDGSRSDSPHTEIEESITIGQRSESSDSTEEDGEEDDGSSSTSGSSSSYESDEYGEEEENLYSKDRSGTVRRRRALNNAKRWFRSRFYDANNFVQNLVAPKPGKDYYVQMWFIELVCFFFIIILPSPFIGNASGNVADFLTQSRLPNSYVLTLLVQFIFIVIERVLYLFRAIKIKVIYHCLLVLLYHIWLLFVSPILTSEDFRSQKILITFYLLKLIYLYLSSLQIMHGYPAFVQGQYLTDSNNPGMIRWLIYIAYRAIPFVYELRTLLDWTVTKTSLAFFEWLKLEDIYANLFLVKCRVSQDRVWERNVGDPQAWYVKWGMGVLLFVGLSALIWFPLLLLMQGSPGNQQNPIEAASISIGFTGYATPIFSGVASKSNIKGSSLFSQKEFSELRAKDPAITYDDYAILQWIEFESFSDSSWLISPPAKEHLIEELKAQTTVTLSLHLTFTRQVAINTGTVADFNNVVEIPRADIPHVIAVINGSHGNFTIPSMLPRYFRIPNSGSATKINTGPDPIGVTFELNNQAEVYWNCFGVPTVGQFPWDNSQRIQLVTFSAEAPRGLLRGLASVGLIGLYLGVVLAVARFLRLSVTDLAFRIIYEDMPACEELISYCEDIYMARQDGDLVLEEELFRELVEIYRSPETIIGRTVRTFPRFAGRPLTEKEKKKLDKEEAAEIALELPKSLKSD